MKDANMNQSAQQNCEETEIDLKEYMNIIIKHKTIIISIFFLSIIAALITTFLMPKVFETRAIIRIGHVASNSISKPNIIEELRGQKLIDSVLAKLNLSNDKGQFNPKKIFKVEDVAGTDFVKITAKYSDPILITNICNTIANDFVSQQNEVFMKNISFLNEQAGEFDKRYKIILAEIDSFNKRVFDSANNPNYPLLQNTITNYETICFALRERIFSLKDQLLQSQAFEVFESAIIPKNAIGPSVTKNVVMAGVVSLMLGIFLVFIIEYWRNLKQK